MTKLALALIACGTALVPLLSPPPPMRKVSNVGLEYGQQCQSLHPRDALPDVCRRAR